MGFSHYIFHLVWLLLLLELCYSLRRVVQKQYRNDSVRIIEGDIFVKHNWNNRHARQWNKRTRRAAVSRLDKIWPNQTIPFTIGENITEKVQENIIKAMREWEKHSCVRFQNWTDQEDYVLFDKNHCGCCSFVGRQGGQQLVSLSPRCAVYGVVLHELGHVIGFWHEHSRPDRDNFIKVIYENIKPDKIDNFRKMSLFEINSLGQPYDYGSIMHYGEKVHSKNNRLTVEPLALGVDIGQRRQLSPGDIRQVNLLYNCPKPECLEEIYDLEGNITSTNYPNNYIENDNCTWIIHVRPGHVVTLVFHHFEVEKNFDCSYDYLEIREGLNVSGDLIGRLCGGGQAGIIESGSNLWLNFKSDTSVTESGFLMNYIIKKITDQDGSGDDDQGSGSIADDLENEFLLAPDKLQPVETRYYADCSRKYDARHDIITTPLIPFGYTGKPVDCTWKIDGGLNASRISLTIKLDLPIKLKDHCFGEIYIVGKKAEKPSINNDINEILPNKDYKSFIPSIYPVEYNCSESLSYLFDTPTVFIHWNSLNHMQGKLQYIIDYDECTLGRHNCQQQCDNTLDGYLCSCYRGYRLDPTHQYCQPKTVQLADRCYSNMTSSRGKLRAGTEPIEHCFYHIKQQQHVHIVLNLHKITMWNTFPETDMCFDNGTYLEIIKGSHEGSRTRHCGTNVPGTIVAMNTLTLHLHTDLNSTLPLPYFSAEYYTYTVPQNRELNPVEPCFHHLHEEGVVHSPGFPRPYHHNYTCVWLLSAVRNHSVQLIIEQMDIEWTKDCAYDFLEIRDGADRCGPLIGRYCGNNTDEIVITSTDGNMWITFLTDDTGTGQGFKARFQSRDASYSK